MMLLYNSLLLQRQQQLNAQIQAQVEAQKKLVLTNSQAPVSSPAAPPSPTPTTKVPYHSHRYIDTSKAGIACWLGRKYPQATITIYFY